MSVQLDVIEYELTLDVTEEVVTLNVLDGVSVLQNGVLQALVRALDFIDGTNTTAVVTKVGSKVTIKINSTASGGGSFVLTNGQGTTANGTAVDLGGTVTQDTNIAAPSKTFSFSSDIIGIFRLNNGSQPTSFGDVDLRAVENSYFGTWDGYFLLSALSNAVYHNVNETSFDYLVAPQVFNALSMVTKTYADTKQPLDADLTAIAALASAADKLPYATGAQAWALTDLSSFMRTVLDDANAAAARATLGISGGDHFQLTIIASLFSPADSTTYYFGSVGVNVVIPSATVTSHVFTTNNFAFTIIGAIIFAGLNTVQGTTELSTLNFRNQTTTTSDLIGTFETTGTSLLNKVTTVDGLSIAVPASQSVCLEWVCPAWATNPTNVRLAVVLICTVP